MKDANFAGIYKEQILLNKTIINGITIERIFEINWATNKYRIINLKITTDHVLLFCFEQYIRFN